MIVHTLVMCTGDAGPEQSLVLFFFLNGGVPCLERLTTYQIWTNKHTQKSDHYQPCLNILCAKYNNKHKPVLHVLW